MKRKENLRALEVLDTVAGGDVSRIVFDGVSHIPGDSVLEQARYLEQRGDGIRRLLLYHPYGDPHMSVDLVVPPKNPKAQAAYIIMEAMGYPVYSGSNTICTATALLESGKIPMREGKQTVTLESPAGLVEVEAVCSDDHVQSITCEGSPAYVAATGLVATVDGVGEVPFDLVYSGGFYALIDAEPLGFKLTQEEELQLAAFGEKFVNAARPQLAHHHPEMGDIGPLSFLHFKGPLEKEGEGKYVSNSATYVHPGVICRSPTGTGTSARMALMVHDGQMKMGDSLRTISPRRSSFEGVVKGDTTVGRQKALRSTITGRAWTLARSEIIVDLNDPTVEDHDLKELLAKQPPARVC